MPGQHPAPPIAIATEVDARAYSAAALFSRGATGIVMPTYDAGEGLYEDILSFLNGRGSQWATLATDARDLQSEMRAGWADSGAPTSTDLYCFIDFDDKIVIEHRTQPTATAFTVVNEGSPEFFGFASAGQSSGAYTASNGDVYQRIKAPDNWTRGVVQSKLIKINPDGVPPGFFVPSYWCWAQDVVTLLRGSGGLGDGNDVDDMHGRAGSAKVGLFDSLETMDNAATDVTQRRIRWGVNAAGRVWVAWPTGAAWSRISSWSSIPIMQALGFDGTEAQLTLGSVAYQLATNPCRYLLCPTRPAQLIAPMHGGKTNAVRLQNKEVHANTVLSWDAWRLVFRGGGPASPTDEHVHWVRHVLPKIRAGSRMTIYQQWGDPRRALRPDAAHGTTNANGTYWTQPAYDSLYTSESAGYRGRIRGYRAPDAPDSFSLEWLGETRKLFEADLVVTEA